MTIFSALVLALLVQSASSSSQNDVESSTVRRLRGRSSRGRNESKRNKRTKKSSKKISKSAKGGDSPTPTPTPGSGDQPSTMVPTPESSDQPTTSMPTPSEFSPTLLPAPPGTPEDTCETFGFAGTCLENPLEDGLEQLFCGGGTSDESCNVYDNYIMPLSSVINTVPDTNVCLGDFLGRDVLDSGASSKTLQSLGCSTVPVAGLENYGVIAASLQVPGSVINATELDGEENENEEDEDEPLNPAFCLVVAPPECGFTFAISMNADTVDAIGANGLTSNVADLSGGSLDTLSFGVSSTGGFHVPLQVLSANGFEDTILNANFYVRVDTSDLFIPPKLNQIFDTEANYLFAFAFGDDADNSIGELFTEGSNPLDIVDGFSAAILIEGSVSLALGDLTNGVVPNLELAEGRGNGYLVGNDDSTQVSSLALPAGYYHRFDGDFGRALTAICNHFTGILGRLSGGFVCPDLSISTKFGYFFQQNGDFGFAVDVDNVANIECVGTDFFGGNPNFDCRFGIDAFRIISDAAGYVVREIADIGEEAGEAIVEVARDTLGKMQSTFLRGSETSLIPSETSLIPSETCLIPSETSCLSVPLAIDKKMHCSRKV